MKKLDRWKMCAGLLVLCAAMAIVSPAQTFQTLFSFNQTDGGFPVAGLVQGTNGNFYGTTTSGSECRFGGFCGTVFEITPAGKLTTLYNFCSQPNCTDGSYPAASLLLATNGNFYGTTEEGGANGVGTVFEITPAGKLTTLYSFCSQTNCADGQFPTAPLIQAANGNLYGTTLGGGANCPAKTQCGTIFKITLAGKLTTLYSFCAQFQCSDGEYVNAGLVQGTNGNFYGATGYGGARGFGSVFEITPAGKLRTLYSFCSQLNCADGEYPYASLAPATNGNFYGTTVAGGANCGPSVDCGTIFEITPSGKLTTVYSFCAQAGCGDGAAAYGGLIQATDGKLYGTADLGGDTNTLCVEGCGTIFDVTQTGQLTSLYDFCSQANCTDGYFSIAGLLQATNGTFYGITGYGGGVACDGGAGCGTVFSLSVGLGPFVAFVHNSGRSGQEAGILGQGFTGTTSVSFNGTAATFTVRRDTFLVATVPTGTTTGYVTVTTPSGTLTSNAQFYVLP